jgi:hypothetical protein
VGDLLPLENHSGMNLLKKYWPLLVVFAAVLFFFSRKKTPAPAPSVPKLPTVPEFDSKELDALEAMDKRHRE